MVPTYLPAWRHGGPILAVHGLCKALAARGHEVTVFTTHVHGDGVLDVPLGKPVEIDGVEVRYFPVLPPRRLYLSPGLGRAARDRVGGCDAVHLHSVFLWPTTAAARAAERADVPYVLSPRGMLVPELLRARGRWRKLAWMLLAERRTIERAAVLHATSDLEAEEAARLDLPLPPVAVVPNGIEPEPWDGGEAALSPAVRSLLDGPPFFLFLGRLSWKKGLDRLIPALARVPGAVLAVAGNDEEGLLPELERLAREAGVAARTVFLGPVQGRGQSRSPPSDGGARPSLPLGELRQCGPGSLGRRPARRGHPRRGAGRVGPGDRRRHRRRGYARGVWEEGSAALLADPRTADAMGTGGEPRPCGRASDGRRWRLAWKRCTAG